MQALSSSGQTILLLRALSQEYIRVSFSCFILWRSRMLISWMLILCLIVLRSEAEITLFKVKPSTQRDSTSVKRMCYWKDDQLYTKSTCFFLDDFPLTSYFTDAELLDTTTLETGPVRSKSSVWGSCWWTFRANFIFLRSRIGWGRLGTTR